ncbi:MAG: choice-of-anchor tandem repeat GloVer-containing protein [Verrucomicrobiia bacterium]|jgi:uncharacterized repeat protein (TIGR03803 family)
MKCLRIPLAVVLVVVAGRTFPAQAQTETNLHTFTGAPTDGANPQAALVQGSDASFYGTTSSGGSNDDGTVFQISPSGTYTSLYSFAGPPDDGADPMAGLVQGSDNNFYGTTSAGGASGHGTVFQISSTGAYTSLHSFAGLPSDGADPVAGLVQGSDGNLYGTTYFGGTTSEFNRNGNGTVFQISPSGTYTTLYSFAGYPTDGADPQAGLVQGSDGNFYGTTQFGGTNTNCGAGCGSIFRISAGGSYTRLYSFAGPPGDGSYPLAGLVQGIDSNLYGTTSSGGTSGNGIVFRISPGGSYTNLHFFAGTPNDGADPIAGLVQGTDSNFCGTTSSGGTSGDGTLFRISPSGTYTTLYSFVGTPKDGADPIAGLVQGTDSNFYGTTTTGGTSGNGIVFEFVPVVANTNCAFSISSTNAMFDAAGGTNTVSVIASNNNCAWTAVSNDSFITITAGTNGVGNGTVTYAVPANDTTNILTGTMTIAGQTFTVTQSATSTVGNCTFTVSATTVKLAAKGGSKNVSVKVQGTSCEWTAVSNDPFITITSGNSGAANGKVNYTVSGNTNASLRTGTMTIAGQTVTVKQATGGCTFKLSPKNAKFKAASAPATVTVKPNFSDCAWTASTTNSWITITDGGNGMGEGTVSYFITPNTNSVTRTGSITIGSATVTVTQSGE